MKTITLILLTFSAFNIYAQKESEGGTNIYLLDYTLSTYYLDDPYSDSTLNMHSTDSTGGEVFADLRLQKDKLGGVITGIFAFMDSDFNQDKEEARRYIASEILAIGDEEERNYHLDFYAKNAPWKISLYTNRGIIKLYYNLDMEDWQYKNLIVYHLR
jgi:hypothetical protein